MTPTASTQAPELAQARATAYTLIAFGFQYPDSDTIKALANPEPWSTWPDVLQVVDARIAQLLQSIRRCVRDEAKASAQGPDNEPRELQCKHDDLFGHAVRGKCPTYEMEYGRNEIIRQASDLADLAGFYRAFGLEFAEGANGRPDHITAECEFMSALCAKEAHALSQNDDEKVDVCVNAQRVFLRDHLARWLPTFVHRVDEADHAGFYGAVARFANAFIETECGHFDIHAGPQTLELRPPDPVLDRTISCGTTDCGTGNAGEQFVQLNVDPLNNQPG